MPHPEPVSMRARAGLCLALLLMLAAAAASPLPNQSPDRTEGTVNCASSTCHGSITPLEGSHVLQNEYTTWLRLDRHTQAYAVLLNERSRSIAHKLGLKTPAHATQLCLDCHSHAPPQARRGKRHVLTEGVGCEGCHGPSEKWLAGHTEEGASHARNLSQGLYPTDRPAAQARLCLSCHFGDDTRFVSHRLMGAGHPRLSFEVKTFTSLEPAHFRVDADYRERKGNPEALKVWAVGQTVAVTHLLETLTDHKRGRQGPFPELVLFDCHSCHHPMSEKRWSPRLGVGPGAIRLNDSNLLMLRAIVRALLPGESASFDAEVHALHLAVATGEAPPGKDYLDLARALTRRIKGLVPSLERQSYGPEVMRRILVALVEESRQSSFADYAGAEQAYMAITSLVNDFVPGSVAVDQRALRSAMDRLLDALADDERYQPAVFQAALEDVRGRLHAAAP
ncbi:MAG: hypothetical protein RL434_541 [Pseudomonadota bacterium]